MDASIAPPYAPRCASTAKFATNFLPRVADAVAAWHPMDSWGIAGAASTLVALPVVSQVMVAAVESLPAVNRPMAATVEVLLALSRLMAAGVAAPPAVFPLAEAEVEDLQTASLLTGAVAEALPVVSRLEVAGAGDCWSLPNFGAVLRPTNLRTIPPLPTNLP